MTRDQEESSNTFAESVPRQDVVANEKIKLRPIIPFPTVLPRSLFLLYAPLKILFQIFQLLITLLFVISPPDMILVQVRDASF